MNWVRERAKCWHEDLLRDDVSNFLPTVLCRSLRAMRRRVSAPVSRHWCGKGMRLRVEVIVVDNGSTDDTSAIAIAHGARVVHEPRPGLAHARQAGLVHVQAPILVFVDADTLLPPGWATAARPSSGATRLVAFSPAFYFHDGRLGQRRERHLPRDPLPTDQAASCLGLGRPGILIGSTMALRTDASSAAGGVDQAFQFYGEDTLIARRLGSLAKSATCSARTPAHQCSPLPGPWAINVVYRYFTIFSLIQLGRIAMARRWPERSTIATVASCAASGAAAMLVAALRREQEAA